MPNGFVTWAEVDLAAIAANLRAYRQHVGPQVKLIGVVKANAYGHGAVPVGRTLLQAGAAMLAVHRLNEAIELRQAGIDAPVLVMGYTPPTGADALVQWRLTPSLTTIELAQALSAQSLAAGQVTPVHIKLDTGMSRYGLRPEETLDFLQQAAALPGLRLEGLFTHFATADWLDLSHTRRQLQTFLELRRTAKAAGISFAMAHSANSAAAMRLPEAYLDAVRPGVALYGMAPSNEWAPVFPLRPALAFKSTVSRVRTLPAGEGISYSRTFITERPTRVALVPVGYGDGYHRILSNTGQVLIGGQRCPILGRVCMDQFVVDVSAAPDVQQDDEVVLVGAQGAGAIRAEEVAAWAGTINYEVTTGLLPRVVRVY